ncbi:MAG: UDP-N-acetylmuramate--L-alanine ligase [Eubacterium sp.]|nr:UDP-N-acetylmuramate--L-alanine ligase [Eubacterium sp.]
MYKIDFNHPCHVHFIGIGGISMSGFAELLHSFGFTVTGSDWHESKITDHLESLGIQVVYGQTAENITDSIDLVVYTAAVKSDNPEFVRAKELEIPMMERAAMVGQVMKNYSSAIAISGTHGKTTTTSIASHIFLEAELDPTISVGGMLPAIGGNIRVGHSEHFITEACEYTNSFLKFFPTVGIILNIEEDHMDFFKDLADIRHSFRKFAELIPAHGTLIINRDIDDYQEITEGLSCKVITYSVDKEDADFTAKNISFDNECHGSFDLYVNGEKKEHYHLNVVGLHNVSNTLACLALASLYGIGSDTIQRALTAFHGTDRRFELKGVKNGFTIIDDYAHHPTEIAATLKAARNYPHKTLWCAFQPHTYTRTRAFLKDFASSLALADKVILADIYAAREKDPGDISSQNIADELKKLGKEVFYFHSFDEIEKFILENLVNGDLLITMGAGNIVEIGENILKA